MNGLSNRYLSKIGFYYWITSVFRPENDDGTGAIFSIKGQKKSESKSRSSRRSQSTPKRILDRQLSQARKTWKIPAALLDPTSLFSHLRKNSLKTFWWLWLHQNSRFVCVRIKYLLTTTTSKKFELQLWMNILAWLFNYTIFQVQFPKGENLKSYCDTLFA